VAPSLVQSKSATAAASSTVSVTLTSATTAGNMLVVCVVTSASPSNPTVTGITIGGSADNFASVVSAGDPNANAETTVIWARPRGDLMEMLLVTHEPNDNTVVLRAVINGEVLAREVADPRHASDFAK